MSERVPSDQIEVIVGVKRHPTEHWGRAVSTEQMVYILHSQECLDSDIDLRDCRYSLALDNGINPAVWTLDQPVRVLARHARLVSARPALPDEET